MDPRERLSMTRRDFMQAGMAASALAGMMTMASAQEPAAAAAAALKPVRVGMVGIGSRGSGLLRTLLQLPAVEINAVCDLIPDRAKQAQDVVEQAQGRRPEAYTNGERDYERLVLRDDLDAVVCATTWQWHTPVSVTAMKAGKYAATEVPAAQTVDECWELVRTSEATGVPCMMLENVCYFQNVLTLLRMVREGVFGELLHAEAGYQHDCRGLMFTENGEMTWRGQECATYNGNLYPTHPVGPVAQWMGINRGDRFVQLSSVSTPSRGLKAYAARKFGPDHPLATRDYALGDVNTTILKTEKGYTLTLYFDLVTPRPYDLILRFQATKGMHSGTLDKVYIEGMSPTEHEYEPFAPYLEKYAHPLWKDLEVEAAKNGGHGGSDYITLYEFIKAVRNRVTPPQDVYDAADWSAIVPLSVESVVKNGAVVEFPDFTQGKWQTRAPISIYGA